MKTYYLVDTKELQNNIEPINMEESVYKNHLKLPKQTKSKFLFKTLPEAILFKKQTIDNKLKSLSDQMMELRSAQYNTEQLMSKHGIQ